MATSRELMTTLGYGEELHLSWKDNAVRGLCGARTRSTMLSLSYWAPEDMAQEADAPEKDDPILYCVACSRLGHDYLVQANIRPADTADGSTHGTRATKGSNDKTHRITARRDEER